MDTDYIRQLGNCSSGNLYNKKPDIHCTMCRQLERTVALKSILNLKAIIIFYAKVDSLFT